MKKYIIPILVYMLAPYVIGFFTQSPELIYTIKIIVTALVLLFFLKQYTEVKPSFDIYSVLIGILIFLVWILPENFYPQIGEATKLTSYALYGIIARLFGGILIAPLVEELFTRSFLIRILINPDWEKVKIGTFTIMSFILTVLFFGFAHSRWLSGLVTGIILNLWLYKKKGLFPCIIAHAVANLALLIYVLATGSFFFW